MDQVQQSPIQQPMDPSVPQAPQRNFVPILVVIIILAILGPVGAYFYVSSQKKPVSTPQVISPTPQATPTGMDTTGWKMYNNHGVSFLYPSEARVKEVTNGSTQYVARFNIGSKQFVLERFKTTNIPKNQTSPTQSFNRVNWYAIPPGQMNTYCSEGQCSKSAPSYYLFKNGFRYSFVYAPDELKSTVEAILSTFQFTTN